MNVAVDIDRQRMGLASALLAELYARVGDEDARFTLEVRRSNHVAIHLYEREGFRAAGMRRRYYQDNGEDALVMWRTPATLADPLGRGAFDGRAQPGTRMSHDPRARDQLRRHVRGGGRRDGRMRANVISSQQVHERFGGVVPEIASRHHLSWST